MIPVSIKYLAWLLIGISVILLSGCPYTRAYMEGCEQHDSIFEKRVSSNLKPVDLANRIEGKVLVMMTTEQEDRVYSGHPTSTTGSDITISVPLGELTSKTSLDIFAMNYMAVEAGHVLDETASYRLIVTPVIEHFEYSFNQLKTLGFFITPQIEIDLHVTFYDSGGKEILSRSYSSGTRDGDSFPCSDIVQERIKRLTQETLIDLMTEAANDSREIGGRQ